MHAAALVNAGRGRWTAGLRLEKGGQYVASSMTVASATIVSANITGSNGLPRTVRPERARDADSEHQSERVSQDGEVGAVEEQPRGSATRPPFDARTRARYSAWVSRSPAKAADVLRLMQALGRYAHGPGRVYFTGGATAVMKGWRDATVDVDIKLDPEPAGAFEAIARIKEELSLNVELASPDQFIPDLPDSKLRAEFIGREGHVEFYHYDLYAQALAKIERGHARDLTDATAMVKSGAVDPARLADLFAAIEPALLRFPAINPAVFRAKLESFLSAVRA